MHTFLTGSFFHALRKLSLISHVSKAKPAKSSAERWNVTLVASHMSLYTFDDNADDSRGSKAFSSVCDSVGHFVCLSAW